MLPPSLGTRLIRTPLVSLSADRPAVSIAISCTVASLVDDGDELAAAPLAVVEVHAVIERRLLVEAAAVDREADAENAVPPTSWLVLVTPGISTPI